MQAEDRIRLQHMLDAARAVARFIDARDKADLEHDDMLRFALVYAIQTIGEAARQVSDVTQQALPQIPWRQMIGMRNRLVHGYIDVDLDLLWTTCTDAVPTLAKQLEHVDVGREAGDVVHQVRPQPFGVLQKTGEIEGARVVERQPRLALDLHVERPTVVFGGELPHLVAGGFEDAVQAAQDSERQDHPTVLVRFVHAAQLIGDTPHKVA